jgi:hypothetical protein
MLQRMSELAWEEEGDESGLYDLVQAARPAAHAVSVVWQSMPPQQKAYLKNLARHYLRQLREDPRGLLSRILMMTAMLIVRYRMPPRLAVKRATLQVVRRRRRMLSHKVKIRKPKTPPPPRPMQSRWQRGRRGNRFEYWD